MESSHEIVSVPAPGAPTRPLGSAPGGPLGPGHQPEQLGPPFEPRKPPWIKRTLGPAVAAIVAFLAKFKAILLLAPKLKLFTTAGTMLVSIAAYTVIWGLPFAFGFVVLLLVHEMGHVIQLRREGIRASAPMFIPFLGAVITSRSLGENALAEARVGLAGPILGSVASAACILVWQLTGNDIWRALAFTGFFLNLFNLIPVSPFDGGRAMAAMAPWMWLLGLALMVGLIFALHSAFILLFAVLGGLDSWRRWQQRRQGGEEQQAYYRVKPAHRVIVAVVYLSLIALLVVGMQATHLQRSIPERAGGRQPPDCALAVVRGLAHYAGVLVPGPGGPPERIDQRDKQADKANHE
jgi:Zn-dependent protease